MHKIMSIVAAGVVASITTAGVSAGVEQLPANFTLEHQTVIQFPITITGQHDLGTFASYNVLGDPTTTVDFDSDISYPGFDHAIEIDLNGLQYGQGLYTTANLSINGLGEDVDLNSVSVFIDTLLPPIEFDGFPNGGGLPGLPGGPLEIGTAATAQFQGFSVGWNPLDVMILGDPQDHRVTVAWNSAGAVPAPGALALLGLAGIVGTRKRRDTH